MVMIQHGNLTTYGLTPFIHTHTHTHTWHASSLAESSDNTCYSEWVRSIMAVTRLGCSSRAVIMI